MGFMAWYSVLNAPTCELIDVKVNSVNFDPQFTLRLDYQFKCRNREPVTRVKFSRSDVAFRFRNSLMLQADIPSFEPFEVPVKESSYVMKRSAYVTHTLTDEDKQVLREDFDIVGSIPLALEVDVKASHGLGKLKMHSFNAKERCYVKLVTPHKEATRADDIVVDKLEGCRINLWICRVELFVHVLFAVRVECQMLSVQDRSVRPAQLSFFYDLSETLQWLVTDLSRKYRRFSSWYAAWTYRIQSFTKSLRTSKPRTHETV